MVSLTKSFLTSAHEISRKYPAFQSAYRKLHNTGTALMNVHNDILTNMNKQHVTLLVLLDLSAASDTVDPSILLTSLRPRLGLNGTALSWFCSCRSGRTQRISVQGALANVFKQNRRRCRSSASKSSLLCSFIYRSIIRLQ